MPGVKVVIQRASIAQMVERKTLNLVVVGSSPTVGVSNFFLPVASLVLVFWVKIVYSNTNISSCGAVGSAWVS